MANRNAQLPLAARDAMLQVVAATRGWRSRLAIKEAHLAVFKGHSYPSNYPWPRSLMTSRYCISKLWFLARSSPARLSRKPPEEYSTYRASQFLHLVSSTFIFSICVEVMHGPGALMVPWERNSADLGEELKGLLKSSPVTSKRSSFSHVSSLVFCIVYI